MKWVDYNEGMENKRAEYQHQWYMKNREARLAANKKTRDAFYQWFRDFKKTLKCQKCGMTHPATLDFHHRDGATKEAEINRMVASKLSKQKIMDEIAKCDVLCANCHRILHYEMIYGPDQALAA